WNSKLVRPRSATWQSAMLLHGADILASMGSALPPTGTTAHPLVALLTDAARGVFPPADGTLAVGPAPEPHSGAVVAFTAHSVVATDLPADEVRAHLPDDDFGAPVSAPFLAWLGQALHSKPGMLDAVLVHVGPGDASIELVPEADADDHARVVRAHAQRRQVR